MDFEPNLSPRFTVYIRDYLLDRNIEPQPVFDACQMVVDQEEDSPPIAISKATRLLETAGGVAGDPYIGLHMAQAYHYESAGLLILAMLAASSVEEGIKTICHYDKAVDSAIVTAFSVGEKNSSFTANLLNPTNVDVRNLNEYLIAFLVQTLNMATRKQMPIREVRFKHQRDNSRELQEFFNAPVSFSQADNLIIFDSSYLGERFLTTNSLLYDVLVQSLREYYYSQDRESALVQAVCREILRQTNDSSPSLESIAKSLAMSGRTLRRKLRDAGLSFKAVKNLALEQRSKFYLSNTAMPMAEIAFELGYSELSAFSRAFRGWTGQSPQNYREGVQRLMRN